MRRLLMLILLIAGMTLPAACGGGSKAFAFPDVSSAVVGVEPTITSKTGPPKESMIKVLTEGKGKTVGHGDVLVANMKSQVWTDNGTQVPPYINTFSTEHVLIRSVEQIVPGFAAKVPGLKVGSRIVLVTPPADGFGAQGNPQIGIGPKDSLAFVVDIVDTYPVTSTVDGKAVKAAPDPALPTVSGLSDPKITVPKGKAAPKQLIAKQLLAGTGAKVAEGQQIVAQYTGAIWDSGTVFDTSWKAERGPFAARIAETDPKTGEPGVIKGWVQGLVGRRVGSRILLVIPPKLGYGKTGSPQAGIKGTDTLVFVVDILGVYNKPAAPAPK